MTVEADASKAQKRRHERLEDIFIKVEETQKIKRQIAEENILRGAINKRAFYEALVQLITQRDLPYVCVEWPELQAVLSVCNYTVENILITNRQLFQSSLMAHSKSIKTSLKPNLEPLYPAFTSQSMSGHHRIGTAFLPYALILLTPTQSDLPKL
ncbi:hypothetical protein V1525DRAFT_411994 [Lipomyces kononenkoae]|uniref:Uncharacterized protein n=1 Tax=Lipomyces kononenkoae TaxID=34357 RepID=A0ACC3ST34_LIPKO